MNVNHRRAASARMFDVVKTLARPGGGVLHCGADDGVLVRALLGAGISARGVVSPGRGRAGVPGRFVAAAPAALPFRDGQFATVAASASWLETLGETQLDAALAQLARVASETVVIAITGAPCPSAGECGDLRPRTWWEARLFGHGLRRHTRFFAAATFEALEHERAACLVMQKLPARAAVAHPLSSLAAERDLHMDMLRETGRRSDAHLARYEWARGWIKPGDVVVDAACGLGYGSAMLWDGSEASRVIGIDLSASAVAYARDCFLDGRSGLEFRAGDAEAWDAWDDHSVDCIVSFETIEHLPDPARFIRGAKRVLKPGGRFLCSVPNEWIDESGNDPNPFHLHVFDLERLIGVVSGELLVDEAYAQSAGGHARRFAPERVLQNVRWPSPDPQLAATAEWWLVSAISDPLPHASVPYVERVFPTDAGPIPNVIAFARDYVNPWAVHALVLGCFRVRSPHLLRELATRWLLMSAPASADAGAALCVLAYRQLDDPCRDEVRELLSRIADYCAGSMDNIQGRRWQISLRFVAGLLHMHRGEFDLAERRLRDCAASDATGFTPHLETKTTEAAWLAGGLALERGDCLTAASEWSRAFDALERIRARPVSEWLVTPRRPAAFETGDGLREITIAVDNATLSSNALRKLTDPGGRWRPGPDLPERNLQRHVSRLAEHAGSGWASARDGWAAAEKAWVDLGRANEQWMGEQARWQAELREQEQTFNRTLRAHAAAQLQAALRPPHALRIGIFGTGAGAMNVGRALMLLEDAVVVWFADNDFRRRGKTMMWVDVIAPSEIVFRGCDLVVIGSMSGAPIRTQLLALGIPAHQIVAPDVTADEGTLLNQLRTAIAALV